MNSTDVAEKDYLMKKEDYLMKKEDYLRKEKDHLMKKEDYVMKKEANLTNALNKIEERGLSHII